MLAHEAIGHLAAEELLDQTDYQRALSSVQTLDRVGNKTIRGLGETVDDRQPGLTAKSRAKEILALAVENGSYKNIPLLQKAVAAITSWVKAKLRALGLNWKWVNSMSEGEVFALLREAERRLEDTASGRHVAPYYTRSKAVSNAESMASVASDDYDYAKAGLQLLAYLDGADGLFQYKKAGKDAKTLTAVAKEIEPGLRVESYDTRKITPGKAEKAWEVRMPDGTKAYVYEKNGRVWINAAGLDSGVSKGTLLYALAGNYAYNTGKVFIGDPDGLSIKALIRRTENMASLAIKFGTTRFLYPHAAQIDPKGYYSGRNDVVNGNAAVANEIQPIKWSDTNDDENMRSLLKAAYKNAVTLAPEVKNVRYDFETGRFVTRDGSLVDDARFRAMSDDAATALEQRGLGAGAVRKKDSAGVERTRGLAGSATLKRAALIGTLVRGGRSEESWGRLLDQIGRQLSGDGLDPAIRKTFYSRNGRQTTFDERVSEFRKLNSVTDFIGTLWQNDKSISPWMKTVGTQYHTAVQLERQGKPWFKQVFDKGQDFLGDVSAFAIKAENLAPTLFPRFRKPSDIFKRNLGASKADVAAIAKPLYEGTLVRGTGTRHSTRRRNLVAFLRTLYT